VEREIWLGHKRAVTGTEAVLYDEADLLPLSALQHLMFCERQCALIHIEQAWQENRLTAEGRVMHERAHEGGSESRGLVRTARGLRVRSLRLGLIGQADVVEFPKDSPPLPVEYKRGKPKANRCDEVQLCAQAMCLEEMLGVAVPCGALFYGKPRRRTEVVFDAGLRKLTETTAARLHALIHRGETPPPVYEKKCESCSLMTLCQPKLKRSVDTYLQSVMT
jgi:CRISPR-associated exonuclease Cas4